MPRALNQGLKLLYIMKILQENTDEDHPMTASEIIKELNLYDITAERKSIYSDIALLREFGIDIVTQEKNPKGFFVGSRDFQLAELKLMVDAVQSSHIISKNKSADLVKKLSKFTSRAQAKHLLNRQVYQTERKTINEQVYYAINEIHQAINTNRQIAFKYFDYDNQKRLVYRRQGALYQATPVTLCWDNDRYYLIVYSEKYKNFTHYRVDRMHYVEVLDAPGIKYDKSKLDVSAHIKRVFGMYGGEIVLARLAFCNRLINTVLDHFGSDTVMIPTDGDWFEISVMVSQSPVFFSWIFQFGDEAIIKSPDSLITAMRGLLEQGIRKYL